MFYLEIVLKLRVFLPEPFNLHPILKKIQVVGQVLFLKLVAFLLNHVQRWAAVEVNRLWQITIIPFLQHLNIFIIKQISINNKFLHTVVLAGGKDAFIPYIIEIREIHTEVMNDWWTGEVVNNTVCAVVDHVHTAVFSRSYQKFFLGSDFSHEPLL